MNAAYGLADPNGLSDYSEFTRWQIMGGNASHWTPYSNPAGYPDQLALNGLYDITQGNIKHAFDMWQQTLLISQATYNATTNYYDYPGLAETYHLGLWAILGSFLYPYLNNGNSKDNTLQINNNQERASIILQHYVSQRIWLLNLQIVDANSTVHKYHTYGGNQNNKYQKNEDSSFLCGWTSSLYNSGGTSLINTESVAVSVLALGAGGYHQVIEADASLMTMNNQNEFIKVTTANNSNSNSISGGISNSDGYVYDPLRRCVRASVTSTLPHTAMLTTASIDIPHNNNSGSANRLEILLRANLESYLNSKGNNRNDNDAIALTITLQSEQVRTWQISVADLVANIPDSATSGSGEQRTFLWQRQSMSYTTIDSHKSHSHSNNEAKVMDLQQQGVLTVQWEGVVDIDIATIAFL